MKPSLPKALFDVCVIPRHDRVAGRNVVATVGALNDVQPPPSGCPRSGGLVLVGGPSKHFAWDEGGVIRAVADAAAEGRWTVSTSRRTPDSTTAGLLALRREGVEVLTHDQTPPGWVRTQLAASERAIVTGDSVSMISEAVTAGCRTAVIRLPGRRASRVAAAVEGFLRDGFVCRSPELATFTAAAPLAEADRVACELVRRFGWAVPALGDVPAPTDVPVLGEAA